MHKRYGSTIPHFAFSKRLLQWSLFLAILLPFTSACKRNKRLLLDLEGHITVLSPSLDEERFFGGTQTFKVRFEDADGIERANFSLNGIPVWQKRFSANTQQSTQTIVAVLSSSSNETQLRIEMVDRLGHHTNFERTLQSDTQPPALKWEGPILTGMPQKAIEVNIAASDLSGIKWVRVKQGENLLTEMDQAPYSFILKPEKLQPEPFFFQIEAQDKAGNIARITVPIPRQLPGADDACNEKTGCQPRMYCIRVPPEKLGTCRNMCRGNENCRAGYRCTSVGVFRVCMPYKALRKAGPYQPCSPNLNCIDSYHCIKTGNRNPICLPACDNNPDRCPQRTKCTKIGKVSACAIIEPPKRVAPPNQKTRQVGQTCDAKAGCIEGSFCIRDGSSEETRCRAQCNNDSECPRNQFCDQSVVSPGACMPRQKQAPRAGLHEECSDDLPCQNGAICVIAQRKGYCHEICKEQCTTAGQLCLTVQGETSACFTPCRPNNPACPKSLRCILSAIAPRQTPYICQ
ncbi:MAG: hypothetical protein H6727_17435 [Myxococcales bacterium]|nr:hypothetical protein [Myxococcales bacterium]